jgi:hypothetical protein
MDPFDEMSGRLAQVERDVNGLKHEVSTVKLEQKHMVDLFSARFLTLEKSHELTISELRSLNTNITTMASEPDKSPAGRRMMEAIEEIRLSTGRAIGELQKAEEDNDDWRKEVMGVLKFFRWVGPVTLLVALAALLKAFTGSVAP